MLPVYSCAICKESINITNDDSDMSALEHLSEVHGIVVTEPSEHLDREDQEISDRLTKYLMSIKGRKINN